MIHGYGYFFHSTLGTILGVMVVRHPTWCLVKTIRKNWLRLGVAQMILKIKLFLDDLMFD